MPRLSKIGAAALAAFGWTGLASVSADFLVIAGGGAGGGSNMGGGGGAGGYRTSSGTSGGGASAESKLSLNLSLSYSVIVGAGGTGNGGQGSDSVFSTITSTGGGGGVTYVNSGGTTGGSGGGGSIGSGKSGTSNQGYAGGSGQFFSVGAGSGGGGGAGAVGGNSGTNDPGPSGSGGAGVASSITGSSVTRGGGGGGAAYPALTDQPGSGGSGGGGAGAPGGAGASATVGTAGTANTGGGGGGSQQATGANGGSGVVIISYPAPQKFGGGIVTTSGSNVIHTFNTSGTLTPLSSLTASYLIVAGGGGTTGTRGGGGGGGGMLAGSGLTIDTNSNYVVVVGAGGAGGAGNTDTPTSSQDGTGSSFSAYNTSATGGGSGGGAAVNGRNGGSGGGGGASSTTAGSGGTGNTPSTTPSQGTNGGTAVAYSLGSYGAGGGGGGGGSSGVAGSSASGTTAGNGGNGTQSSISGTATYYAGGGGGGGGNAANSSGGSGGGGAGAYGAGGLPSTQVAGTNGTANLGGGGGGGSNYNVTAVTQASGGSGVVIISYAGSTQQMAGGTVTISGGNVIHTFTSSGYLTPIKYVNNSLRFRSSASAYFNRTPASATNRTTWTWSGWVKRGSLGTAQMIFQANAASGTTDNDRFLFYFNSSNQLEVDGALQVFRVTNAVFRDPSAWYHIVLTVDTGNATTNNRMLLYVNGVSQSFSTNYALSSSQLLAVNGIYPHYFSYLSGSSFFFDGYLTEINFIDGQALTPNSFGTFNSYGVWQPITYGGSYGTNGFYLPFTNKTSTTTLGYDFSPNGNNWTPNNISLTAGSTYDSMTDVPTLTSATAANYCVLNPLNKSSSSTVSNGNLRQTSSGGWYRAYSTIFFDSTAVFYAEATMTALNSGANGVRVGIANANSVFTYLGSDANSWSYDNQGNKYNNGTLGAYGASYVQGDVIGILFNNGSLTFYKNGASQGVAYSGLTGTFCFAGSPFDTDIVDWNFGQRPFSNLPSGALALNTYNLPASTITNGAAYMAATTYTGNVTARNISNAVNGISFQPDLVWIKNRTTAYGHVLQDSIRGTSVYLASNSTAADTAASLVTAFNSDGFAVSTSNVVNENSAGIVGWQWKAGGTSSSNTNGSITSTVSAGATQGFSVVTYTGTGANATVGHGLGVAPNMVIVKDRSVVTNWAVYHSSLTSAAYVLLLNLTAAQTSASTVWNSTAPTSSVFSIGTSSATNTASENFVAYCFAAVAGYSAFGSYTGNGSTDGTFVFTGFRPRFVLIKISSGSTGSWYLLDSSRDTYNVASNTLFPDLSNAEGTGANFVDFLSNGFKLRNAGGSTNGSGFTFIYAAFAETAFKFSNAR